MSRILTSELGSSILEYINSGRTESLGIKGLPKDKLRSCAEQIAKWLGEVGVNKAVYIGISDSEVIIRNLGAEQ